MAVDHSLDCGWHRDWHSCSCGVFDIKSRDVVFSLLDYWSGIYFEKDTDGCGGDSYEGGDNWEEDVLESTGAGEGGGSSYESGGGSKFAHGSGVVSSGVGYGQANGANPFGAGSGFGRGQGLCSGSSDGDGGS